MLWSLCIVVMGDVLRVNVQVEEKFLPSVYERVTASLEKVSVSGRLVDDIIHGAVARAEAQRLQELERVRLQREAEEKRRREEEAARLKVRSVLLCHQLLEWRAG